MSETQEQYRVLIIGGGPGGLLMAQALKKHGIQSTVFEQDPSAHARPRDWNFGIYWAQSPLTECLPDDLCQQVIKHGQVDTHTMSPNDVMPIYNGATGDLLKAIPAPNSLRLHRRNFLRIIGEGIDIQYGKRLLRVESDNHSATAYFEDGTSASGNLLIGAEGAHSKVREYLLGEEAKLSESPVVATVTMAKLPKEAAQSMMKLHHRYNISFHPQGIFTWMSVHDAFENTQPGDWTFMMMQSWKPEPDYDPATLQGPAILEDMKERAKQYAEPYCSLFESIPEGTKCWHSRLGYWIPRPWDNHNSTITLLGDAAHPMTFHRGQGFNNAIVDVASLARIISEHGTATPTDGSDSAITMYEKDLWVRGQEAVASSNENTLATHDWSTLQQSPLFKAGLTKHESRIPDPKQVEVAT